MIALRQAKSDGTAKSKDKTAADGLFAAAGHGEDEVVFAVREANYVVKTKNGPLTILDKISFTAKSGEVSRSDP